MSPLSCCFKPHAASDPPSPTAATAAIYAAQNGAANPAPSQSEGKATKQLAQEDAHEQLQQAVVVPVPEQQLQAEQQADCGTAQDVPVTAEGVSFLDIDQHGEEQERPATQLEGTAFAEAAAAADPAPAPAAEPEAVPTVVINEDTFTLLPAISYMIRLPAHQKIALDNVAAAVCQALGEGPPGCKPAAANVDVAALAHLKSFDFAAFFSHARQLPARMLMVLLVLTGQQTTCAKRQGGNVAMSKARRMKAAAEQYFSPQSPKAQQLPPPPPPPQQQQQDPAAADRAEGSEQVMAAPPPQSPGPQQLDVYAFKKMMTETDPAAYNIQDTTVNRAQYTSPAAAASMTRDTAAEVLATASFATRDQLSNKFGAQLVAAAAANSGSGAKHQLMISNADMKKCLPAVHRLRGEEAGITVALLRSEVNDVGLAKGIELLRQLAAEYAGNARYAASLELPVVLPEPPAATAAASSTAGPAGVLERRASSSAAAVAAGMTMAQGEALERKSSAPAAAAAVAGSASGQVGMVVAMLERRASSTADQVVGAAMRRSAT